MPTPTKRSQYCIYNSFIPLSSHTNFGTFQPEEVHLLPKHPPKSWIDLPLPISIFELLSKHSSFFCNMARECWAWQYICLTLVGVFLCHEEMVIQPLESPSLRGYEHFVERCSACNPLEVMAWKGPKDVPRDGVEQGQPMWQH